MFVLNDRYYACEDILLLVAAATRDRPLRHTQEPSIFIEFKVGANQSPAYAWSLHDYTRL